MLTLVPVATRDVAADLEEAAASELLRVTPLQVGDNVLENVFRDADHLGLAKPSANIVRMASGRPDRLRRRLRG